MAPKKEFVRVAYNKWVWRKCWTAEAARVDPVVKDSDMASKKEFLKLAKTKWGRRWRVRAAEALHVDPVTVWRWMQFGKQPPEVALIAMRAICKEKVDETKLRA